MSEYSLTSVFVVPVGNTLPTTGGTQNLTAGQFGVFKDEARTIATNGNIATAAFIQFFQGREASIGAVLGSKPSDKIKSTKLKKWYKIVGSGTAAVQITTVGDFTAGCGEDLSLTIRAHSSYLDMLSFNGLTRSITVKTPCCACGEDPCTVVDNEALVDLIIAKLAEQNVQVGTEVLNINTFFTFAKTGTGDTAVVTITGKPLTVYSQPADISANPYEFDRMWFRVFVSKGPATSVDFDVADSCESAATVTITQRSSYPVLTSREVKQMEFDYYSYQSSFKHLFTNPGYNQYFESFVTDGTVYDQYTIEYGELNQDNAWTANQEQDEKVILFFPTTAGATVETMLTTYLGAPEVKTAGTIVTSPLLP